MIFFPFNTQTTYFGLFPMKKVSIKYMKINKLVFIICIGIKETVYINVSDLICLH